MSIKFSIIIPTKSRPKFVDIALKSLHCQTFKEFEVIVSDDYEKESCEEVVSKYCDGRFRYIVPPKNSNFGMCQNWEYGLEKARGEYVIFIQDKMYMYADSLSKLNYYIERYGSDVISWNWDYYLLIEEGISFRGRLSQKCKTNTCVDRDLKDIVRNKISFSNYNYQNDYGCPGEGSPLCSAVKRTIYDSIRTDHGMVFDFINPDYGPPILILDYARNCILCQDNLTVLIPSNTSEGKKHSTSYEAAISFLAKSPCGMRRMEYAPLPNLMVTNANMVAADYNYSLNRSFKFKEFGRCNYFNAIVTILLNVQEITDWPSKDIRDSVYKMLNETINSLDKDKQKKLQTAILKSRKKESMIIRLRQRFLDAIKKKIPFTTVFQRKKEYYEDVFDTPQNTFTVNLRY